MVRQLRTWSQAPLPPGTCGSHVCFKTVPGPTLVSAASSPQPQEAHFSELPVCRHASLLLQSFGPGPSPTGPTGRRGIWEVWLEKGTCAPGSHLGKPGRVS